MSLSILLALAATVPEVPASSVQVAEEGTAYVMRNLIDSNPLYTFDLDEPGQLNCNDTCAQRWTPLRAADSEQAPGKWTRIRRGDGSLQWAYDGMPVYSFARDPEPVTLGDGRTGTWHLLPTFPSQ